MEINWDEVRHDSWRLVDGGTSMAMTHLPTGAFVHEDRDVAEVALYERIHRLRTKLEQAVEAALRG